ncbi:26S proteasome regulatory subunit N3 [Enteropsectra breve]|nr:26S proteasome regulatory subunit N3 [Enteropsectra breve]
MENLNKILDFIKTEDFEPGLILDLFLKYYDDIVDNVEPESIADFFPELPNGTIVLGALYTGALYRHTRYENIISFVERLGFFAPQPDIDFYVGTIYKYLYRAITHLNSPTGILHRLYIHSKEYKMDYSSLVLLNCILDHNINNNVFLSYMQPHMQPNMQPRENTMKGNRDNKNNSEDITFEDAKAAECAKNKKENLIKNSNGTEKNCEGNKDECIIEERIIDREENAKLAFYSGFIAMVNGEYKQALLYFDRAEILNRSPSMELKIKKYTVVVKLLLRDYNIFYPYQPEMQPYFGLIGAVRRAERSGFEELLKNYQEEFFGMRIFFVVRRLAENIYVEGLRKISRVYSRISVSDVNDILGFDSAFLMHKMVGRGALDGYVQDGIFYGKCHVSGEGMAIGSGIREAVNSRKVIEEMMRYPEILPFTYETMMHSEK